MINWAEQAEFGRVISGLLDRAVIDENTIEVVNRPKYFKTYMVRIKVYLSFPNAVNPLVLMNSISSHSKMICENQEMIIYTNTPASLIAVADMVDGADAAGIDGICIVSKTTADNPHKKEKARPDLWYGKYLHRVKLTGNGMLTLVNLPVGDIVTDPVHRYVYCNDDSLFYIQIMLQPHIIDIVSK